MQNTQIAVFSKDIAKKIISAIKMDSKVGQLRKAFYLSPCGEWITYKKREGYSYHKTEDVLNTLNS